MPGRPLWLALALLGGVLLASCAQHDHPPAATSAPAPQNSSSHAY